MTSEVGPNGHSRQELLSDALRRWTALAVVALALLSSFLSVVPALVLMPLAVVLVMRCSRRFGFVLLTILVSLYVVLATGLVQNSLESFRPIVAPKPVYEHPEPCVAELTPEERESISVPWGFEREGVWWVKRYYITLDVIPCSCFRSSCALCA
jgi:hypothetical protein